MDLLNLNCLPFWEQTPFVLVFYFPNVGLDSVYYLLLFKRRKQRVR